MRQLRGLFLLTFALACSSSGGDTHTTTGDSHDAGDGVPTDDDAGDSSPTDDSEPPPDRMLYVSGAAGVQRYRFNQTSAALTLESTTPAGDNPSFLVIAPSHRTVYVADEEGQKARAFTMAADGALSPLGVTRETGGGSAHIGIDKSESLLWVANYGEGTVRTFPLEANHGIGTPSQTLDAGANAHQIVEGPLAHMVYVPCLGADYVAQYTLAGGTLTAHGTAALPSGSGPRHIAFHPTRPLAYVLNELKSTLVVFDIGGDGALGNARPPVSTLPAGFTDTNSTAEVQVAPSGNFVYISNRGRDSIAIFSIAADGSVTRIADESTRGGHPRHFSIDPTGKWLFVANRDSDNVAIFSIDTTSGLLTHRTTTAVGDAPQFVVMMP